MSDELKNCPFCGGIPELLRFGPGSFSEIGCGMCGLHVALYRNPVTELIAAWNRRAQPTIPEIPARTPPIDPDLLELGEGPRR
jgi:hypothetical protein